MIQRAEEKDIPELLRLLAQVNLVHHQGRPDLFRLGTKYDADALRALLADEKRPVFADVDGAGRMAGYAFCVLKQELNSPLLTDIRTLYIDDLCVDEICRGRGVGRGLFAHVKAYAAETGCHNVTLNVWCLNEGAMRFYERLGLKPQKIGLEMIL